jgi:uncharacterized protein YbbK (DUF523 family)
MIVISACLCGLNTRYNGKSYLNEKTMKLLQEGKAMLVCPEQLGGLSTPRPPHEIVGGTGSDVLEGNARVKSKEGCDSTKEFISGAEEVLKVALQTNAKFAILKAKSPSCGCGKIYDGSFLGNTIVGNGVTAELLMRNGIKVFTEENIEDLDL